MKLPRVKCVLVATFLLTIAVAPDCAGAEKIVTYVNGERVDFSSHIVRSAPLPILLIRGHAMIPARFLNEVLHESLDLHLLHWDIVPIGGLSLKLGEKVAIMPVPKVGGARGMSFPLPIAVQEIEGRVYVPARVVLNALGHAVEWDPEERAIRITEDGAPQKKGAHL